MDRFFVANLDPAATAQCLRAAFEAAGVRVRRVTVACDPTDGRPRGFAFIECRSVEDPENLATTIRARGRHDGRPWFVYAVPSRHRRVQARALLLPLAWPFRQAAAFVSVLLDVWASWLAGFRHVPQLAIRSSHGAGNH